ncbi:MAG: hypothetical protein B7Y41_09910 [Hydrogenophilales bacterium 28-61-23]|nr:MAG: hypothetical protein B7Y41_09910 [Hydrogenophilales bacterium 28-61-23]
MDSESILVVPCRPGQGKGDEMKYFDSLVEANLYSINVDPTQKEVRIELAYAGSNARLVLFATSVDDFVADEMRISNVIDRVRVFGAGDAGDPDTADCLFLLMRGRFPNAGELEWSALQDRLAAIHRGALTLLEIEPVYGAKILLLAGEIKLQPA